MVISAPQANRETLPSEAPLILAIEYMYVCVHACVCVCLCVPMCVCVLRQGGKTKRECKMSQLSLLTYVLSVGLSLNIGSCFLG